MSHGQSRKGVLGAIDEYNEHRHGSGMRLGYKYGTYEAYLRHSDLPESTREEKSNDLIEEINYALEKLHIKLAIPMYSKRSECDLDELLSKIVSDLERQTKSLSAYFIIGTAAAMLLFPAEEPAMSRLGDIEVQLDIKINRQELFTRMRKVTNPKNGRTDQSVLSDLKSALQQLHKPACILFITADPRDNTNTPPSLRVQDEYKNLQNSLRSVEGGLTAHYQPIFLAACQKTDIQDHLITFKPQIVHFAGHGSEEGLVIQTPAGKPTTLTSKSLASMLVDAKADGLETVVITTCYSASYSSPISSHVDTVIAMEGYVGDKDAADFTRAFYYALTHAVTPTAAFNKAKNICVGSNIRPVLIRGTQTGNIIVDDTAKELNDETVEEQTDQGPSLADTVNEIVAQTRNRKRKKIKKALARCLN